MANDTCLWLELLTSLLELLMRCRFVVTAVPDGCAKAMIKLITPLLQPEAQCIPGKQASSSALAAPPVIYVHLNTVQSHKCCLLNLSMLRHSQPSHQQCT